MSSHDEAVTAQVDRELAAFVEASGGPTLGWPAELHDAFLRVAIRVQQRVVRRCFPPPSSSSSSSPPQHDSSSVFTSSSSSNAHSYNPVGSLAGPHTNTDGRRNNNTVRSSSPPPPPPPEQELLAAATEAFYTVASGAEVEAHVARYLELVRILQRRRNTLDLYGLVPYDAFHQCNGQQQQYQHHHQGAVVTYASSPPPLPPSPQQQRGRKPSASVVMVPASWCRGTVQPTTTTTTTATMDAMAPALEAAARAVAERAGLARQQRLEKRRCVAEWRAQREAAAALAAEEASAAAAADRATAQAAFRLFRRGQQRRGRILGDRPVSDNKSGGTCGGDGGEEEAAQQRRALRRESQALLAGRRRCDLAEAVARRERVAAFTAYEQRTTKAAVAARYLRSCGIGDSNSSTSGGGGCLPPPQVQRYLDPTASSTQHALPDAESELLAREMGSRGRWLSSAEQRSYASTATGAAPAHPPVAAATSGGGGCAPA